MKAKIENKTRKELITPYHTTKETKWFMPRLGISKYNINGNMCTVFKRHKQIIKFTACLRYGNEREMWAACIYVLFTFCLFPCFRNDWYSCHRLNAKIKRKKALKMMWYICKRMKNQTGCQKLCYYSFVHVSCIGQSFVQSMK